MGDAATATSSAPTVARPDTGRRPDVIVVGAGIIGLSTAWRAVLSGLDVTVIDPAPASGASGVAAGMLAPVTEVAYGEESLLRLNIAGARRWPDFTAELEAATGHDIGHQRDGTLLVAFDADDHAALRDLHGFQQHLGLEVDRRRSRECRAQEPMLSPRIRGGVFAPGDHHVDPRRTTAALAEACRARGVTTVAQPVERIDHDGERVLGVTTGDGATHTAPRVVLAAGVASGALHGLPASVAPPVRPVKGQILRLRSRDGTRLLSGAVRGIVQGRSIYLVPRRDDELVVGATQEELGHDRSVTAGGVRELLDAAVAIVPGVDELTLAETAAGLRPGTPDNHPLVGATDLDGLMLATGHHRHGVLLAPITAEAVVACLLGETPPAEIEVADPRRSAVTDTGPRTSDPGRRVDDVRSAS
jgi:glycine oxidase